MCWQIFKPFIDLLKWNLRLQAQKPKNGFSNFCNFLFLAWLSRYKVQQKETFSINGERLVAVEYAMLKFEDESEFLWWQTDRMTEWKAQSVDPRCTLNDLVACIVNFQTLIKNETKNKVCRNHCCRLRRVRFKSTRCFSQSPHAQKASIVLIFYTVLNTIC